jgi:allantoicase
MTEADSPRARPDVRPDLRQLPDVAGRMLGGTVVHTNDDTFADVQNLLSAAAARHDPSEFGLRGKVYDGWETRRRRTPGSDVAIIRLAAPSLVHGVNVDTSFFKGNYPPHASVHATTMLGYPSAEELLDAPWTPLIERASLGGDTENVIAVTGEPILASHVRLTIHPDGGVARFRVYGEVVPDPRVLGGRVDLAATVHGARLATCSNMFYSSPANVLSPGRAQVMSDGWETSRRRDDGNDWLVVRLAAPGQLHDAVIDTSRFLGNAPGWARLSDAESGAELLPMTRLQPDTEHRLRIHSDAVVSLVRLDIHPDGGLSRLRLNGAVAPAQHEAVIRRWTSLLGADQDVDVTEFFS